MSKFKVGAAKTRRGNDAYIFEVSDYIYGEMNEGKFWSAERWSLEGQYFNSEVSLLDLLPNDGSTREEFETKVGEFNSTQIHHYVGCTEAVTKQVIPIIFLNDTKFKSGDRVRVTIEAIE